MLHLLILLVLCLLVLLPWSHIYQAVHSTHTLPHLIIEYSYVLSLIAVINLFNHQFEFHCSSSCASLMAKGIHLPHIVYLVASAIVLGLVVDNNFCSISFCWNFAYTPCCNASNPCSNHVSLSKSFTVHPNIFALNPSWLFRIALATVLYPKTLAFVCCIYCSEEW